MFGLFGKQREIARLRAEVLELQKEKDGVAAAWGRTVDHSARLEARISELTGKLQTETELRVLAEHECKRLRPAIKGYEERCERLSHERDTARDALKVLAERYRINPEELRQLQVAGLEITEPAPGGPNRRQVAAKFVQDETDPLVLLNRGEDFKQTAGKFRQLRQHFVTLQLGVTGVFDRLQGMAREKPVTSEQIAEVRSEVSGLIGRRV